jgi:hypothetical protein
MDIRGATHQRREETSTCGLLLITRQSMLRRFRFPIIRPKHVRGCTRVKSLRVLVQGRNWSRTKADSLSSFFQKKCKILGERRVCTSSYHAASNGMVKRIHRSLQSRLSHYLNTNHKNWDEVVPYYLRSHRATPQHTTGYSPFYLLHGRKKFLPSTDNLKARLPKDHTDEDQRLENTKSNLRPP